MTASREVLFTQGAGEGTHDAWDDKLVGSLQRELGDGFDVRYPRMPHEDNPSVAAWVPAIRREVDALRDGAVAVGHSIGGTILIHVLAGHAPAARLAAIVLVAAPFVGPGGWPARAAGRSRGPAASRRPCPPVPRSRRRDGATPARRPVRPSDPTGTDPPAARARPSAGQRPSGGRRRDPCDESARRGGRARARNQAIVVTPRR